MKESMELREKLFGIKNKFLGEIPHIKLIDKAIDQVKELGNISEIECNSIKIDPSMDLKEYLNQYMSELLGCKLAISSFKDARGLVVALTQLKGLQFGLINKLASYLKEEKDLPNGHLKLSTPIDIWEVLKFVQRTGLKENQISAYIRRQIDQIKPNEFDSLVNACLRADKIKRHGR